MTIGSKGKAGGKQKKDPLKQDAQNKTCASEACCVIQ